MARSGSITRAMGRRRSEASPSSVAAMRLPASRPSNNRIVVPEFAQSSVPCGVENPLPGPPPIGGVTVKPLPWPPFWLDWDGTGTGAIRTPTARRHAMVARTSSPSGKPRSVLSPSAIDDSISARWAIDLSPGTRSSPATRVAGRTVSTVRSSERSMAAHVEEIADRVLPFDPIAKPLQGRGKLVDRPKQGVVIHEGDALVHRRIALRQSRHAAVSRAPQRRVGVGRHRLGVRRTDGEGEMAEVGNLLIVLLGRQESRSSTDGRHELDP